MKKIVLAVLLIAALLIAVISLNFLSAFKPASYDTTSVTVDIPKGSSTNSIALILKEKNLIKNVNAFKLLSKIKKYDNQYMAGVYSLSASMTPEQIMKIIASGKSDVIKLTIPGGWTLSKIAQRFEAIGICSQDEFWEEIATGEFNYKFIKDLPEGINRLEGFLYPETYFVYKNATAHECIDKMLSQFDLMFTESHYQKAADMDLSVLAVVTVASLIERETTADIEGGKVASVIYNRLKIGQPLGIDASIQYALPNHKQRLTYEDLKVKSPYNTYTNKGLPPGPICSPGIDAINAALNPEDTDYFYYVLSPNNDGTHNFSHSYEEFLINKAKYKESLK
ncbi:MAG: endolytic transglycosylase MltG [Eubacteriales bacterium]